MKKNATQGLTTPRPRAKRKTRNAGRRVRVGPITSYGKAYGGAEGVLVEKTSDPAWPYKVVLDSGVELSLDDWQFDYVGAATDTVQPMQIPKTDLVKSGEKTMAKTTEKTKATREPIKTKRVAPTTRREPVKAKARSTVREPSAKKGPGWNETILDLLNGRKAVKLSGEGGFYEEVEAKLSKSHPNNSVIRSTIRRTLQALRDAGKVRMVEKGTWGVATKAAKA